jgi:hypothetical protein
LRPGDAPRCAARPVHFREKHHDLTDGALDECDLDLFSVAKIKKILFKNNRLVIRSRLAKVAKHLATPTVPFAA